MELSKTPDVIVIGSGAGGASVAYGLVSQGAEVLLLEAGPWFEPVEDYPQDSAGWERRSFPVKEGSQASITFGDLGVLDTADRDLMRWSDVAGREHPQMGQQRLPYAGGYSHVMGVGGSTLHYVGEAHRLHPEAFRFQTLTGQGADWPISYDDLEPYYTQVEHLMGVAGTDAGPARWQSAGFALPPHPMSTGAQVLMQSGDGWVVNPRAVNSEAYDERPACNYCGQCSRGCPLGDKASVDVTLLRRALDSGRLTLMADAHVTRLVLGAGGRVSHLDVVHQGAERRIEAPQVVLAAGAVNTPRLLLASASAAQPNGVANGSGQVGRHFMETLRWESAGLVQGLRKSHMGLPSDATDWGFAVPNAIEGLAGGFKLSHTTLDTGLGGPIGYATRMVPGFGAAWKAQMRAHFGSALSVAAIGQVVADERSKVVLDAAQVDRFGVPVAQIHSVLTQNSLGLLRAMQSETRAALAAAGADLADETSSWDEFIATHVFGTARMAARAEDGVVNGGGQSFDHENLWISDASVFPTSGAGEAPSLTIMALGLRMADAILG